MARDRERIRRVSDALREAGRDALVCFLPINVLFLSGYWPVVGTSIALATSDSRIVLLVPEDESQLASSAGADEVGTFRPGSLDRINSVADAVRDPLGALIKGLGLTNGQI